MRAQILFALEAVKLEEYNHLYSQQRSLLSMFERIEHT